MLYLKLSRRITKNRNNSLKIQKAIKDKEYKTVILKEEGLVELDPEAEIKFDDKGFEDTEVKTSDSED